jgi:hypothetical protein
MPEDERRNRWRTDNTMTKRKSNRNKLEIKFKKKNLFLRNSRRKRSVGKMNGTAITNRLQNSFTIKDNNVYGWSYYWNFRTSSFKQVACLILAIQFMSFGFIAHSHNTPSSPEKNIPSEQVIHNTLIDNLIILHIYMPSPYVGKWKYYFLIKKKLFRVILNFI